MVAVAYPAHIIDAFIFRKQFERVVQHPGLVFGDSAEVKCINSTVHGGLSMAVKCVEVLDILIRIKQDHRVPWRVLIYPNIGVASCDRLRSLWAPKIGTHIENLNYRTRETDQQAESHQ